MLFFPQNFVAFRLVLVKSFIIVDVMLILKLNNNKNNINNIERTQATATAAASERNKIYNKTMDRYKIMYKNILEKHKINEKYITHDTSKREGEKEMLQYRVLSI